MAKLKHDMSRFEIVFRFPSDGSWALPTGGITQLVEWLLCKQHVAGSNPTTSTNHMGL